MKDLDQMPKSIVKAIRYIKQDAPEEKLDVIHLLLQKAIVQRKLEETR